MDIRQRLKGLDLFLLLFTFLGLCRRSAILSEEDRQLGLQVALADFDKLFSNDFDDGAVTTGSLITLLLVLSRLLISVIAVISSSFGVSRVFVIIRLLLVLTSSGIIVLTRALRIAVTLSTSVV